MFLLPARKLATTNKPEFILSIIDSECWKRRILTTLYVQWYNSYVVSNWAFTKTIDDTKPTIFRYEAQLTSLDEDTIDVPTHHLMSIRPLFRLTKEMNEGALRMRARSHYQQEDDDFYHGGNSVITQTTIPTTSITSFQRPVIIERPKKKTLHLVSVNIDQYLI